MWELDHKENWVPKNRCFWTVVLEKTLEGCLASKEIKPAHPKENQPWIFISRTGAKAEDPILWPPDEKSWFIGKDPDTVKDWGQEKKGTTEDEMVGWHHRLNGHEFEQTLGDGEGQGSLVCCCPWGHKESDTTEQLNNNNCFTMSWILRFLKSISYEYTNGYLSPFLKRVIFERGMVYLGLPGGLVINLSANADLILGLGRFSLEGNGNPL